MEQFSYDSVLELNPQNVVNSHNFLTITHTTLSTLSYGSYGILTIDVTTEFCFWTEQRLNRLSFWASD
jgi:hypothetical protein